MASRHRLRRAGAPSGRGGPAALSFQSGLAARPQAASSAASAAFCIRSARGARPARGARCSAAPSEAAMACTEQAQEAGSTMIFSNSQRVRGAFESIYIRRRSKALLVISGRRLPVGRTQVRRWVAAATVTSCLRTRVTSRSCRGSRPAGAAWTIEDLDSTNGIRVNGASCPRRANGYMRATA